jgi:hypothetical protein
MHRGQPEERLEGGHGRAPSVEAEGEFVQGDLEVGVTNAVAGADQPGLEVAEDPVDAREELLGAAWIPLGAGPVPVAHRAERGVALPGVGNDARAGRNHGADESGQGPARSIGHDLEPDPARGSAEATRTLFREQSVRELSHAYADNLDATVQAIANAIGAARASSRRGLCFITGSLDRGRHSPA